MAETIKIKNLHLAHTKEGKISISHVEKPYGEFSDPIMRLSISLHEDEKATSLDIPYDNVDDIIASMKKAQATCDNITHEDIHGELLSDMGGGQ